jgi:hypothetical protein
MEMKMFNWFFKKRNEKLIEKSVNDFDSQWKADLDSIWAIADKNQFLISMYSWLCRKCNYGEDIGKLSKAERTFFINSQFESEVNNGGFSQFFYNSSGDFANETLGSLNAIGAIRTAELLKKALMAFGGELPTNRNKRELLLDKLLTDSISEILDKCDTEFYQYVDNLEELNYEYILSNKDFFA